LNIITVSLKVKTETISWKVKLDIKKSIDYNVKILINSIIKILLTIKV
jgi:hypothetical protein